MSRLITSSVVGLCLVTVLLLLVSHPSLTLSDGVAKVAAHVDTFSEQYGFEQWTQGWGPSDYWGSQAITGVVQSSDRAKVGTYSLKMYTDLNGSNPYKRSGEALVDMGFYPPPYGYAPLNLDGMTIVAWVYAPIGARGNSQLSNGVHLFVKDVNGNSLYGTWQNILEDGWFQVSLKVSHQAPPCGGKYGNFDPTRVIVVGINIGTATGSTATYSGPIYLDSVSFGTPLTPPSDHRYDFNDPTAQSRLPRWDLDPGWGAAGLSRPIVMSNSLAMTATFGMGSDQQRKGYVGIIYSPHLNLSNKTHQIIQADIRFDPPPSGNCPFVATVWAYDGEQSHSYSNDNQNIGGADWNTVIFDLADGVQYSPAITTPVPIPLKQIEKVGIQLWANEAYSGTVYFDNIIIGGLEISSTYTTINQGIVTVSGTQFMLNGQPFRFAGANAEYLFTTPDPKVEEALQTAHDWKLTVGRTWGFGEGCESPGTPDCIYYSPYFQPARGVWNETTYEHLDRIVATAGRLGIRLIIPLVNNWEHYGGMYQYMEWVREEHPESLPPGVITGTDQFHDLFYTNPYAKQWYKDSVTRLISRTNSITGIRYADDPTIFSWELTNEARAKSDVSGRTMHQWLEEMSEFVRSLDSKHMIGTGEEGWFLMTKAEADACCSHWQTFPTNYWQYGVNWMDSYGNNWGSNGTDFVSDHRSITTTVSWQDCVDVYQTPPRCDTTVHTEDRAGLPNISYAAFRTYIDERESNLYRAPYCYYGFDSALCNAKYDFPYDQALLWMEQHLRAAHDVIGKPVIMEEFGIHVVGDAYGGGGKKYHLNPPYTEEHRRRIFQKYYDFIYNNGMNGSLFWNLGYRGLREELWNGVENLVNWSVDPNSDATAITLSSERVSQGNKALRLNYDPSKTYGKALVNLGNLHEDWYSTNRAKFTLDLYNAGDAAFADIAISTSDDLVWHESRQQPLRCGWNKIMVDVSSETWKSQRTNWEYTGDIAELDKVRKISIGIFGYTKAGSVYVDNMRIFYDDGFVIYPEDMLGSTIMLHACKMAGITCYSIYLPLVSKSPITGPCQ